MIRWGAHKAPWQEDLKKRPFDVLRQDLSVDVVVVGAGITGLMTAMHLQDAGLKVAVLTAGEVGDGATGVSTGHLTQIPDGSFAQLLSNFGEDAAKQFLASSKWAIDTLERVSKQIPRDSEFIKLSGFKFTEVESDLTALIEDMAIAQKLGLGTRRIEGKLPFVKHGIFEFEDQAMFNPLSFIIGLAEKFVGQSGLLFEQSRIIRIDDESAAKVHTGLGSITAKSVVLATHTPVGNYLSLHTRLVPLMTYVMGVRLKNPPATGLFWDKSDPYFYFRPWKDDIWLVGGRDHKTGQNAATLERYIELEDYTRKHFEVSEVCFYWGGEFYESLDYLPYIGKIPFTSALYTGTGYGGTGLTLGVVASQIIADLILGRENKYSNLFDPSRIKPIVTGHNFLRQNANVAKWMITDHLTHHHVNEIKQIAPNEGRVVDVGDKKLAVYRNENGRLHVLSSKCTHLGGTVHWNSAEKTWDCPCHGGRYKANGEICEGPQLKDLEDVPLYTEENPDVESPGLSPMPDQLGVTTLVL